MTDPATSPRCTHGWRASAADEAICDRCPSCGMRSLFIGKGGYLTCSSLQCPQPAVGREIERLRSALATAQEQLAEVQEDKVRLDWLEGERQREKLIMPPEYPRGRVLFRANQPITRAAIDAARRADPVEAVTAKHREVLRDILGVGEKT